MEKGFFLFVDILTVVAVFFVVRMSTNLGWVQQDILKVGLLISIIICYVYFASKKKDMTLRDIRFRLPKNNHWLLLMGVVIPALYYIPSLLFPGEWVSQPWDAETWRSVFLPVFLHNGLGSGISEELLFRGYLLKHTERQYGRIKAVAITSLAFGLVHLLNGFSSVTDVLWTVFNTGMIGAVLAMVTYVTGSLIYPMIVHGMVNLSHLLVAAGSGGSSARFYYLMDEHSVSIPLFYGCIAIGLVLMLAFLIFYDKKHSIEE